MGNTPSPPPCATVEEELPRPRPYQDEKWLEESRKRFKEKKESEALARKAIYYRNLARLPDAKKAVISRIQEADVGRRGVDVTLDDQSLCEVLHFFARYDESFDWDKRPVSHEQAVKDYHRLFPFYYMKNRRARERGHRRCDVHVPYE